MTITKYNVLNPKSDRKKPYYDISKDIFYFPVKTKYRYFVEASQFNLEKNVTEYFLLLGTTKFDENCRLCEVDGYGKCKIKLKGEIKDYVKSECTERGNIECNYIETEDNYDVFRIS